VFPVARVEGWSPPLARRDRVLPETRASREALHLGPIAAIEAWRIETKLSRYRPNSVAACLIAGASNPVEVHP
jgi:hypothetical protein